MKYLIDQYKSWILFAAKFLEVTILYLALQRNTDFCINKSENKIPRQCFFACALPP